MDKSSIIGLKPLKWSNGMEALMEIRVGVFVHGQGVPFEEEEDEHDPVSYHLLATVDGRPAGTGRLTPDGRIGRMAVLERFRGLGVGMAILDALLDKARQTGMSRVRLSAQTHAMPFYGRRGFVPIGEEYDDCGIPHIDMVLDL